MNNIMEKVKRGIALDDFEIIDCHGHIGCYSRQHIPQNSAEGMLESMNTLGIDIACISSFAALHSDYHYGNDLVIKTVATYPERFFGYITLNPNYAEDMKNELKRCFAFKGVIGIKLHPFVHAVPLDSKLYITAFEFADKRKIPILVHTWGNAEIDAIGKVAQEFPGAKFIAAHTGGGIKAMEHAFPIIKKYDNLYGDLALSETFEGNVEWFVKEIGSKKILFGTDMVFMDPRPTFGRIAAADITIEEKKDIFGLNMQRILNG